MTSQLLIFGILGLATTAVAFYVNRHLFTPADGAPGAGRVSFLEGVYYVVGVCSIVLGWYFNVRYTHTYHDANYWNYTKMLFSNWAADSAAQDYVIVNVILMPLWTIVEGSRRGLKWAWIFFVMSLFTSLAFAIAFFLAFMERQWRYNKALAQLQAVPPPASPPAPTAPTAPTASKTA
jgi:hypothetical protein